jgi:hypothetical protein
MNTIQEKIQLFQIRNSWIQIFIAAVVVVILLGAGGVWWWCVNNGYDGGWVNWNFQQNGFVRIECYKR